MNDNLEQCYNDLRNYIFNEGIIDTATEDVSEPAIEAFVNAAEASESVATENIKEENRETIGVPDSQMETES